VTPLLASFAAGLIAACGFQPIGLWPVTLAALALWLWQIEQAPDLRSALARGWWFGAGYFVLGLNWIATSFTYQSNMPAWLGWIAVVLLSGYLAVYPAAAAGLAWRYGHRNSLALVLVLAAAVTVTEWLRATLFTGFAWNPLGVVLLPTPVSRLATLIGTYGLSGVAVLTAGIAWLVAGRRWTSALVLLGGIAAATGVSFALTGRPAAPTGITVRVVQPNVGQEEKWKPGFEDYNMELLARLSRRAGTGPRLLLWPEAAVTRPLQDERRDAMYVRSAELMRRQVSTMLAPGDLLLTGGLTIRSRNRIDATSATNSIFAIAPGGHILARYDKAHLVPYGEYLPMRPLLSAIGLSRLAPGDIDFDPGPGAQTLALPLGRSAGLQLCYEIIFSGQVVDRRHRPAFLFNPSNDAWFGAWGPPQHLAQARMRALEEGLPVLRATPTGMSAVIDADGRLVKSLKWRTAGAIDALLPAPKPPTLFARTGNLMSLAFALLLAAGAIAVRRKQG
jgi:apolipoprotein N-acyltransferase